MPLAGMTVLLVEDEPIIALDVTETLERVGAIVHGPMPSIERVRRHLDDCDGAPPWDVVVLDFRLKDGTSEGIARILAKIEVPFVLHTANSEIVQPLAEELGAPVVAKPAGETELVAAIGKLIR